MVLEGLHIRHTTFTEFVSGHRDILTHMNRLSSLTHQGQDAADLVHYREQDFSLLVVTFRDNPTDMPIDDKLDRIALVGTLPEETEIVHVLYVHPDIQDLFECEVVPHSWVEQGRESGNVESRQKTIRLVEWSMIMLEPAQKILTMMSEDKEQQEQCAMRAKRVHLYHDLELLLDSLPEEERQPILAQLSQIIVDAGELARKLGVFPLISLLRSNSWWNSKLLRLW